MPTGEMTVVAVFTVNDLNSVFLNLQKAGLWDKNGPSQCDRFKTALFDNQIFEMTYSVSIWHQYKVKHT